MIYDCIIIGGGVAGLQAAIQLGRYKRKVLVIDNNNGRSSICHSYHNILGWPDGVSGTFLREQGYKQALSYGVEFLQKEVISVEKMPATFFVTIASGAIYAAKKILLSTGVMDNIPPYPAIRPCLGLTVYVCPDCDGYEIKDKRTIVLGAGNTGANMALTISYWSNEIIYINDQETDVSQELLEQMKTKNIAYINVDIEEVLAAGANFQGVLLKNGEKVEASRAFIAYGQNEVKSNLAKGLGVELLENKHIVVDPRTKMTNVDGLWAAGDVVAHSEQVTIAMGEGSQAAIWIHKSLLS
ncbi:NAD(P)/FAD-dependent oxidoreductase [Bacillus alkalisoli]|uniref:NAD(P)/FAD-dependent oxidoreductase n=1 Tax=Bacillus alkalisoli TaxID=2011008 RepID=UPI000C24C0AB|nr:NAD(P)/FAD-dependent oxidoreductase [Bacillus alkalisoli]